jgi:hypothetical protein
MDIIDIFVTRMNTYNLDIKIKPYIGGEQEVGKYRSLHIHGSTPIP